MERLWFRIDMDGDFSFKKPIKEFNFDLCEMDLYFSDINNIKDVIINILTNFKDTLNTSKNYLDLLNTIKKDVTNVIDILNTLDEMEYLQINLDYGNQYLIFEVSPDNIKKIKVYDTDEELELHERGENVFITPYPMINRDCLNK